MNKTSISRDRQMINTILLVALAVWFGNPKSKNQKPTPVGGPVVVAW